MADTKIEWATKTWNPTLGCSRTSPGCDKCYAISMSHRISAQQAGAGNQSDYIPALTVKADGLPTDWTGELRELPGRLGDPLKWAEPERVFVNSMSDLFHVDLDPSFVFDVFDVMIRCRRHEFMLLTKRSKRMRDFMVAATSGMPRLEFNSRCLEHGISVIPGGDGDHLGNHISLGVSVESASYKFRLEHLRDTPAGTRFVSAEPLLGSLGALDLTDIDLVIVGGESGPGARPMHPEWAREIRDQCIEQNVAFFFKQWGMHSPHPTFAASKQVWVPQRDDGSSFGQHMWRHRSKKFDGSDLLDGRQWLEYPAASSPQSDL